MTKILLVTFDDPNRPQLRDALLSKLELRWVNGRSYSRNADRWVTDLRNHQLWCEATDRPIRPILQMAKGLPVLGRVFHKEIAGRYVTWVESDLRLVSGGLTVPVVEFVQQLITEFEPDALLSAGLGNGVRPDQKPGDLVLAARARYHLMGELNVSRLNALPELGTAPPVIDFSELTLHPVTHLDFLPPTLSYAAPEPRSVPYQHQVLLERLPILTRPRLYEDYPDLASPVPGDDEHWAELGCCVDRDVASLAGAANCPSLFVIGLVAPAVRTFPEDHLKGLRMGWLRSYWETQVDSVAANVASTIRYAIERV